MNRALPLVLAATLGLTLAACGDDGDAATADGPPAAAPSQPEVEPTSGEASGGSSGEPAAPPERDVQVMDTVATGLEAPWGLAFLPDGSALVSERDSGKIKSIAKNGTVRTVGTVPDVEAGGEGGLLGIAVAEDFADAPQLYAYLTAAQDNRIVRMRYSGNGLGRPEVVLDGIEKSGIHNGGRIAFGPDGMLYAGTGDASDTGSSQDPESLNGKILRMTPDGKAPQDNPEPGSLVYSSGHRNVQGLAFDAEDRLWAAEFGQNTTDELNLIRPGENYGWPMVEGTGGGGRFANPAATWSTDEASPSGIAVLDGSVWMAALRGSRLWEIPITGAADEANPATGDPRAFFRDEYGRLRTVAAAPDGSLWLITSNTDGRGDVQDGDDRILRLSVD